MRILKVLSVTMFLGGLVSCATVDASELVSEDQANKAVLSEIPFAAKACVQEMLSKGSGKTILQKRGYKRRVFKGGRKETYIKKAPAHHAHRASKTVRVEINQRKSTYDCEISPHDASGSKFKAPAIAKAIQRELSKKGFSRVDYNRALDAEYYKKGAKTIRFMKGYDLQTED